MSTSTTRTQRFIRAGAATAVAAAALGVTAAGPASAHHNGIKPTATSKVGKEVAMAARWAQRPKVRAVRQCESGGNYKINTGNGFYGAYQFAGGTWLGVGGGHYAQRAHQAPKWAQDYMAWRLWKSRGWQPWECAHMV